jgi:hypothetical protein
MVVLWFLNRQLLKTKIQFTSKEVLLLSLIAEVFLSSVYSLKQSLCLQLMLIY